MIGLFGFALSKRRAEKNVFWRFVLETTREVRRDWHLLKCVEEPWRSHPVVVIAAIEASGARAHIPSQSNVRVVRTVDPTLYRERNRIERFFNRLKHFRGIATRYFKTAANFLAALHLASARLWIRYYESTT